MKFAQKDDRKHAFKSLSARRAWIEIFSACILPQEQDGRSPQGERGLKFVGGIYSVVANGRSPQGERGLKLVVVAGGRVIGVVALRKESVD